MIALNSWVALGLLSAMFAALVAILAKLGLQHVDATLATTIRAIVMTTVLITVSAATGRFSAVEGISINTLGIIALSGLAGAASWLCYFLAIQLGEAGPVSALDRLSIVFVVLLAGMFLGEDLSPTRLLGTAFIVVGALLVAR